MWIDSHNHLQDSRLENKPGILLAMKNAGVSQCVVNATGQADWEDVSELATQHPDFILPAYGIHPWQAHTAIDGWEGDLQTLLRNQPKATIGECGLDLWINEPDIQTQIPIFEAQLEIAREMDRTITIHCLKAWDVLFEVFKRQPPPLRFLMHSFGGSIEIARRLIPLGAYFSFSGYFLQPRKAKVIEVFRHLPLDRILLETDAPDMLPPHDFISHPLPESRNHPANLASIAEGLANALGQAPAELSRLAGENFRRCFP